MVGLGQGSCRIMCDDGDAEALDQFRLDRLRGILGNLVIVDCRELAGKFRKQRGCAGVANQLEG